MSFSFVSRLSSMAIEIPGKKVVSAIPVGL
jgi:hypothetical protein